MMPLKALLVMAVIFSGSAVRAEVIASAATGFVSEHELLLPSDPNRAYEALTTGVANWWNANHSYSGVARNFSMEAKAGGCFCESLPDGGSVEHMRVVYAAPGKLLRLSGGLGPLQGMGVSGAMSFALEATEDGRTRLRYLYVVTGFAPGGLNQLAEPVDRVQLGQLQRLAAFLAGSDIDN